MYFKFSFLDCCLKESVPVNRLSLSTQPKVRRSESVKRSGSFERSASSGSVKRSASSGSSGNRPDQNSSVLDRCQTTGKILTYKHATIKHVH